MRVLLIFFLLQPYLLRAQSIKILTQKKGISFRGLSVVNNKIIWVSGSFGTVGRSKDGGKNWSWFTIKDYEKTDFRDIEAFDENTAVVMGISEPGIILKTIDGGEHWKTVYTDSTKGIFLDAMDFNKNGMGMVVGDPIQDTIYIAQTLNYGNSWDKIDSYFHQSVKEGEAMFASSGTNIRIFKDNTALIISGGMTSRLWFTDKVINIPILQGCKSCGGNSVAYRSSFLKKCKIIIVGGDFSNDRNSIQNCLYSNDFGKTWKSPTQSPHGYRSCVEYISSNKIITCGTSGVDLSNDGGKIWNLISPDSFHACKKAKSGSKVFLAGKEKIAVLMN